MSWLSDSVVDRLRASTEPPDLSNTKYQIVEPLAQGGMGTVYVAYDRELERQVALKVLGPLAGDLADRLLREARILARLEHPGIVPVHDVGTLPDGRLYYVMKLVRGSRLDAHAATIPSLAERLRVFLKVCEAVGFAHAHGVIHRDLKPDNVMVGPFGEVLVMDWGIAKVLSDPGNTSPGADPSRSPASDTLPPTTYTSDTAHGTVLGTPGFMAPEQARGDVELTDQRADVYALGAILYVMLTGRPPEPRSAPRPPRAMRPEIPKAVEAVCLKAMSAELARRYDGVPALEREVVRYLNGQPVEAYPESVLERALRVGRKYRTPILLVLAYLLMRVVLLVVRAP